jgi:hypothetical protein
MNATNIIIYDKWFSKNNFYFVAKIRVLQKVFMKLSFFVGEGWNIYLEMEERLDSDMGCGWENAPSE